MKTAIYIEDGKLQVVLTPENDWEKGIVDKVPTARVRAFKGADFYQCHGGWIREFNRNAALILLLDEPSSTPPPP